MFEKMRRAWLAGTAVAVMGLPGPLCVLACLEDTQFFAASAEEMPCHEKGPSEPSDPEPDCDCSTASAPVLLAFEAPAQLAGAILRAPSFYALARTNSLDSFLPRVERIPAPDILLQKSTLIV